MSHLRRSHRTRRGPFRRSVAGVAALAVMLGLAVTLPEAAVAGAPTAAIATASGGAERGLGRAELDRQLRRIVRSGGIGAVAELDSFGHEWRGAAGRAFRRPGRHAVPGARFRAASNTKMLTAVLALQLVNRGRWTLDTTVGDVLPGLWPGRDEVTLRQLLSHTSGLPDYLEALLTGVTSDRDFVRKVSRHRTDAALIRLARRLPVTGDPGETFSYSNTNFVIVGMMLRRATHQPVRRLAERRILRPAKMTQTTWAIRPGLPRPQLHEYLGDGTRWLDLGGFDPTLFSSAGALVTTGRDLNRFQRALSHGRILPRPLVRQMRSVQAVDPTVGMQYGLGSYRLPDPCSTATRPRWVYGHDGASFGTFSVSMAAPGGRRAMAIATNGRTTDLAATVAMVELLYTGLAASCAPSAQRAEQVWPVERLARAWTARQEALLP